MKLPATILALMALATPVVLAGAAAPGKPSTKVYQVAHSPNWAMTIDGVINEAAWNRAVLETDFCFPWRRLPPPPTRFRALCDDESFYFCFDVEDHDVVLHESCADERAVGSEDRVELFLAPDLSLKQYYGIEMDPLGRKLDYKASFHRQFDRAWQFPEIEIAGQRTSQGYIVEGRIPLRILASLGLPDLHTGQLRVGIYRAEFSHGDGPAPIENWIAWVNPHTQAEDFHIPGTFGIFQLRPRP